MHKYASPEDANVIIGFLSNGQMYLPDSIEATPDHEGYKSFYHNAYSLKFIRENSKLILDEQMVLHFNLEQEILSK